MRLATPLVREARLVPRQISNYEVMYLSNSMHLIDLHVMNIPQ